MSPEIDNGDIVICDPFINLENGDLVHYTLFNENAIKIYYKDENDTIKLIPRNKSQYFFTRTIANSDYDLLENFKIAKVVRIIKVDVDNRKERLRILGLN